jgi:AraC-like DNA-binding protein
MVSESARSSAARALRGVIARYDGYRQRGVAPTRHLGLPSPFMTLIVTLEEPLHLVEHVDRSRPPASYQSLVGGLHVTPVVVGHDGAQSGIQARVSPIASRALFGMPAGELAGIDLAAGDVLGRLAAELHERLSSATSWPERFAILDAGLALRLGDTLPPAPVINAWTLLRRSRGSMPISRLAREVGWSERQLAKRFELEIGFSPKLAARVIRFDHARLALQSQFSVERRADIAWVAAECGYHDQSHLVRDFRAFTGLAPSRWLAQEFGNVQAEQFAEV